MLTSSPLFKYLTALLLKKNNTQKFSSAMAHIIGYRLLLIIFIIYYGIQIKANYIKWYNFINRSYFLTNYL